MTGVAAYAFFCFNLVWFHLNWVNQTNQPNPYQHVDLKDVEGRSFSPSSECSFSLSLTMTIRFNCLVFLWQLYIPMKTDGKTETKICHGNNSVCINVLLVEMLVLVPESNFDMLSSSCQTFGLKLANYIVFLVSKLFQEQQHRNTKWHEKKIVNWLSHCIP